MRDMTPARVMKMEKAFPVRTPMQASHKMIAIREQFGVSQTRYYQYLASILETPEFIELDPIMARIIRERQDRARPALRRRLVGDEAATIIPARIA